MDDQYRFAVEEFEKWFEKWFLPSAFLKKFLFEKNHKLEYELNSMRSLFTVFYAGMQVEQNKNKQVESLFNNLKNATKK